MAKEKMMHNRLLTALAAIFFAAIPALAPTDAPVIGITAAPAAIDDKDCLPWENADSGPVGSGSPFILDFGMNLATGNTPWVCDGCRVKFHFMVTWLHSGDGVMVDPWGVVTKYPNVVDGQRFVIGETHWIQISCDSELRYDFISEEGGSYIALGCYACLPV